MHWVLQENLHQEDGHETLLGVLQRWSVPHSVHKVVPFVGALIPDVEPSGSVIVMGTYSMCRLARQRGWKPGCFDVGAIPYAQQLEEWGKHFLNAEAHICTFGEAAPTMDPFFMRPISDSKVFAGTIMSRNDLLEWQDKVIRLGEDDGSGLSGSTEVYWCAAKPIDEEYRLWIVNGIPVTASRYHPKSAEVPIEALEFGRQMTAIWSPLPAFVMDVCLSEGAWKLVEINTLNASGFYAADLDRLVSALESLCT